MYQSILVPVDGSAVSCKALGMAAELIEPGGGPVYVLNLQVPPTADDQLGRWTGASAADAEEAVQKAGHAVIEAACEESGLKTGDVQAIVRAGDPARRIIAEAERLGVEAIVLGSRGASNLESLVLGSVSHRVLHTAPCTVIVVR